VAAVDSVVAVVPVESAIAGKRLTHLDTPKGLSDPNLPHLRLGGMMRCEPNVLLTAGGSGWARGAFKRHIPIGVTMRERVVEYSGLALCSIPTRLPGQGQSAYPSRTLPHREVDLD
jgi:hypothetical protein